MKITFRIREISYGDAMCRAVPILREKLEGRGTSSAKIFLQLLKLPPEVIRAALDAMPEEEKKDLALPLISEYKDRLLQGISRLLAKTASAPLLTTLRSPKRWRQRCSSAAWITARWRRSCCRCSVNGP